MDRTTLARGGFLVALGLAALTTSRGDDALASVPYELGLNATVSPDDPGTIDAQVDRLVKEHVRQVRIGIILSPPMPPAKDPLAKAVAEADPRVPLPKALQKKLDDWRAARIEKELEDAQRGPRTAALARELVAAMARGLSPVEAWRRYRLGLYRMLLDALHEKGISVYAILGTGILPSELDPEGHMILSQGPGHDDARAQGWIDDYVSVAKEAAGALGGRVASWEVLNEPDNWMSVNKDAIAKHKVPAKDYKRAFVDPYWNARILEAAYAALHGRGAKVISGPLEMVLLHPDAASAANAIEGGIRYWRETLEAGVSGHVFHGRLPFDGVGIHDYLGDQPGSLAQDPAAIASLLHGFVAGVTSWTDGAQRTLGDRRAPLGVYVSEIGASDTGPEGEAHQASVLAANLEALASEPRVADVIFFKDFDFPGHPYGLYGSDGKPRQAGKLFLALSPTAGRRPATTTKPPADELPKWMKLLCAKIYLDSTHEALPAKDEADVAAVRAAFEAVHLLRQSDSPPKGAIVFSGGGIYLSNGNGTVIAARGTGADLAVGLSTLAKPLEWVAAK